jgi:putative ABC transport system permease protein
MGSLISELKQDVRYGLRLLVRNPSFTIISVLTLALGIGATSTIFSVLDTVVLRPLPFRDPDRLVWVQEVDGRGRIRPPVAAAVAEWKTSSQTLEEVGTLGGVTQYSLAGPAGAQRVRFGNVGLTALSALGVQPVLGRWFQPDEAIVESDTAESIVISHGFWQTRFGGDPSVIGKPMPGWNAAWGRIIIGVMPPGFWVHPSMSEAEGWFAFDYPRMGGARPATIARLKPGVTLDQAQAEIEGLARRSTVEGNTGNRGNAAATDAWRVQLVPLHDVFTDGYANTLYVLLGAISFVLLIAAVNVANLQLSRGVTRQTEMSTRVALGARRGRLLRQLVTENVLLGLAGGVLGVLVAYVGIWIFVTLAPQFYPPSEEIAVSRNVLLFTLTIAVLAGVLSGLVPALRASRPNLQESMKQGARGTVGGARQNIRRVLVVAEMALALVLLTGAGLMINSYARLMGVDMGLNADNVLAMEVGLVGQDRYRTRHGQGHFSVTPLVTTFYTDVMERIAAMPGVRSVAVTSVLPPSVGPGFPIRVVGGTESIGSQYHEISANYFETMEIPMLRGRAFTDRDTGQTTGVAIINETMARQLFRDEDPIGRYVQVGLTPPNSKLEQDRPREVVGVVRDTRMRMRNDPMPVTYVPYQQHLTDYASNVTFFIHAHKDFVVRTEGDPMNVAAGVRQAFNDVDPAIAVDGVMPMRQRLAASVGNERFWLRLLGLFAGLALFLAALGIYGVISYSVEQRQHEFGLRVVLGAQKSDVMRLVAREGVVLTLAGLVIGVGAAFGLTRLIANQLYDVTPMDPLTIAEVAVVLVAVACLASYIPSRRAFTMDPVEALRAE